MPGPPRKPTALKRYEGFAGKNEAAMVRREASEPMYPNALPDKPSKMSAAAARHWTELTREMSVSGVLKRVDKDALRQLCEDQVMLERAYETFWKAAGKSGDIVAALATDEGAKAMRTIREVGKSLIVQRREFGLTPSARARVVVDPRERPQDAIDEAVFNRPAEVLVLPKSGTGR